MKNIITLFLISSLILACSKSEDDSSDDTTNAPAPVSPTELNITLTGNTSVALKWKDNASNEIGFKIERKADSGSFTQVGIVGSDVTSFADTGLVVNTTYIYRVVAYGTEGYSASYSNPATIRMYPFVTIGTLTWMPQNLDIDHYRNGDPIPQVTDATQWANLTTGAWCYYKNSTANGTVYGKLYNWYAVNDPRGLAPNGWHVATKAEWITVTDFLGGEAIAGGAMKSMEHWSSPNTGATNSSGFSALGGGARIAGAAFNNQGVWGAWWTADNDIADISFYRILYNDNTKSEGYHINNFFGMSVRCVRD